MAVIKQKIVPHLWFDKEANQVDPEKDALEDRLVALYAGWKSQMAELAGR